MTRKRDKRDTEHQDDIGIDLAPAVTPDQREALYAMRYRGPWPSTQGQAADILRQWRSSPAASVGAERPASSGR